MDLIYKGIYIGSWKDGKLMKGKPGWTVITVANDAEAVGDYHFKISDPGTQRDDEALFQSAVTKVLEEVKKKRATLVHCQSGVNRSVSVALAAVMILTGMDFAQAYDLIKSKRKHIWPHYRQVVFACNMAGKTPPEKDWKKSGRDLTEHEKVVDELYRKVLKRSADPDGLNLYAETLAAGRTDPARLERALRNSTEYKKKFNENR
jgi:hypothetical protein